MVNATDIITLPDAKQFLNITSTTNDGELAGFISTASQMWARKVGPVAGSQVFDEWYDGGGQAIVLRHTPVLTLTSVTEAFSTSLTYTLTREVLDGTTGGDAYGYTLDPERGLLIRRAMGAPSRFAPGRLNVHVVYTAGYATVPDDIKQAVMLLVKHAWETQRGATVRPGQGGSDYTPGASFAWPQRVQEIAASYMVPGIA